MRRRLILGLIATLALTACGRRGAVDPRAPIILISIDTLRSDHLPAYGYTRVATPAIDAFSADSVVFERAYSQCPLTLVSHASVFTGLMPAAHGIRDNIGYQLDSRAKTLAEILRTHGYATGGAVSAVVLRGETGIKRGFDFWNDDIELDPSLLSFGRAQRSGDATREIAQRWIGDHKDKPFLFFLHIYEPHMPYEPVEPFRSRYGATYDGEIATADAIVGRFVDYLKAQGLYDRSTILLMSDHGEGLGDHGEQEHGLLLYRETLQVPLMLKLPREASRGTRVTAPVQLIDIYPTLAEAFGVPNSGESRSLLRTANGDLGDSRAIYAETYYPRFHFGWSDLHSIIVGSDHYIHGPGPELYDLAADPAEKRNVLQESRRVFLSLRSRIQPFIHAAPGPSSVDDETKQQLMALGYLGSSVSTSAGDVLPDPKRNIEKANTVGRAFGEFKSDHFDESLRLTNGLLAENQNMVDLRVLQVRTLVRLGRRPEAIEAAKQGLRVAPTSASLAIALSNLLLQSGRLDEAEQHARLALKDTPTEAHRLLADVYLQRHDYEKARREAQLIGGASHQTGPIAKMILGRIEVGQGNVEAGLSQFHAALDELRANDRKPLPLLHFFTGDALARLGRGDEAEDEFRGEIQHFPFDSQAYRNLIFLYVSEGKNREASDVIFSLEKASPTPDAYLAIAQTLKLVGDVNGCRYWAARGLTRFPDDRQLRALSRG
jgi:arylsulfatase A-like enzyme/Flp pilus assembly protein TadD